MELEHPIQGHERPRLPVWIASRRAELLWLAGVTGAVTLAALLLPRSAAFHRRSPHREGEAREVTRACIEEAAAGGVDFGETSASSVEPLSRAVCRTDGGRRLVCRLARPTVYGYVTRESDYRQPPRLNRGARVLVALHTEEVQGSTVRRAHGTPSPSRGSGTITTPLRERGLLCLAWVFLVALGLAGGRQGMRAAAGLAVSGLLLLAVFLPLAVRGVPPVLLAVPVCIFLASVNLVLVAGPTRKMLFALGGTAVGSISAALFACAATSLLGLTGLEVHFGANFHLGTRYWYAPALGRVDFGGLLVSGMMIASLGAAMDVAMAVASATCEAALRPSARGGPPRRVNLRLARRGASSKAAAARIGLRVGWNVVGVMVVTLAFVFFGASLFSLLAMGGLTGPCWGLRLLSYEELAAEVARLAAAGLGMTAAVPVTALLVARFGPGGKERAECSAGA